MPAQNITLSTEHYHKMSLFSNCTKVQFFNEPTWVEKSDMQQYNAGKNLCFSYMC